jgi:hypothetical protein
LARQYRLIQIACFAHADIYNNKLSLDGLVDEETDLLPAASAVFDGSMRLKFNLVPNVCLFGIGTSTYSRSNSAVSAGVGALSLSIILILLARLKTMSRAEWHVFFECADRHGRDSF